MFEQNSWSFDYGTFVNPHTKKPCLYIEYNNDICVISFYFISTFKADSYHICQLFMTKHNGIITNSPTEQELAQTLTEYHRIRECFQHLCYLAKIEYDTNTPNDFIGPLSNKEWDKIMQKLAISELYRPKTQSYQCIDPITNYNYIPNPIDSHYLQTCFLGQEPIPPYISCENPM